MISIQTNVDSMLAQSNLSVDNQFQSKTIQQLTSGYKINSSGDDAAGLAIANGYRDNIAELTQGVSNANDGVSQLQIIDGGMNNISTILDRLNTLATQSASGTFTGNRGVLNSEFQSLVGEVDRQAQAIGLNTNGQFNKALSVFIGGGSGSSSSAIVANGSINLDLSKAQVDTQSLGLKGVQASSSNTYDLSSASATSVQTIVSNAANLGSLSTANTTQFTFFGAGFANDASGSNAGIAISVNTNGISDTNSLVNAVNTAIQSAANASTGAAAAFKAAGITASVVTDSNGNQKLAFSSSNSSFQVQADDLMSNALMGNFQNASTGTGAAMGTTIKSQGNIAAFASLDFTSNNVTLSLSGAGMSSPVKINLNQDDSGAAGDLATDINNQLTAAGVSGVTVTAASAGQLQFVSTKGAVGLSVSGDTTGIGWLGLNDSGSSAGVSATAGSLNSTFTAAGSNELGSLGSATNLLWGGLGASSGDTQSITVNANDANGAAHNTTIALTSNGSDGSLDSIDAAVAALNKQLQQSNDSTLQQITAVAVNDNGVQKINFVSTLSSFGVSVGNATGNTGTTAATTEGLYQLDSSSAVTQGFTDTSTQVGSGGTADISTQAGAQAAVTALTAAVQILGNAQAAVGRGQNQLNYAQGLAQSQITNFSAAESRIRDTDVASAAANLTKSQVLTQTAIAAMAQANSEAQSVMKLLQ